MALIKTALMTTCPNCRAANPQGSPYCSRCGAPISKPSAQDGAQSRFTSPHLEADVPHFADSFVAEGQDPVLARSTFERAAEILIAGETIEYIGVANRGMAHLPDCVVATSKRIMVYKKRAFAKLELGDMFWRDVEGVQMKESRGGVLLIFDSIQGWQIIAEGLPKSQAWRLHEIALKYGERLAGKSRIDELIRAVPVPEPSSAPTVAGQAPPSPTRTEGNRAAGQARVLEAPEAAKLAAQPSQVAAFQAPRAADSGVVVFDTQATQPVLRTPPADGPGPATAAASAPQVRAQARPSSQSAQPSPGSQQVAAGQPVRATSPLPSAQPGGSGKLGSGPLSARLGQSGPLGGQPTVPISAETVQPQAKANEPYRHDDPVRKMKQLKEMLDAGLITVEDYETKKAEILARM